MLRYAITAGTALAPTAQARPRALLVHAQQCAAAGVNFLQLREKDLAARELTALARAILEFFAAYPAATRTRLLINSRADVAVAARADGVHLTSAPGELTPAQVRTLYASTGLPLPVISISCHSLADITSARALAPSLILFGPVFQKVDATLPSQPPVVAGTGLALLHAACAAAGPIPVLALGGVTQSNTADCLAAGAAGIAGIRLFSTRTHP